MIEMTIEELRAEIDRIDSDIIRLYGERLETASQIGRYKQEHHLPVSDPARERDVPGKRMRTASGPCSVS